MHLILHHGSPGGWTHEADLHHIVSMSSQALRRLDPRRDTLLRSHHRQISGFPLRPSVGTVEDILCEYSPFRSLLSTPNRRLHVRFPVRCRGGFCTCSIGCGGAIAAVARHPTHVTAASGACLDVHRPKRGLSCSTEAHRWRPHVLS